MHIKTSPDGVLVGIHVVVMKNSHESSDADTELVNLVNQSNDVESPLLKGNVTRFITKFVAHVGSQPPWADGKLQDDLNMRTSRRDSLWMSMIPNTATTSIAMADLGVMNPTVKRGQEFAKLNMGRYSADHTTDFLSSRSSRVSRDMLKLHGDGVPYFSERDFDKRLFNVAMTPQLTEVFQSQLMPVTPESPGTHGMPNSAHAQHASVALTSSLRSASPLLTSASPAALIQLDEIFTQPATVQMSEQQAVYSRMSQGAPSRITLQ
jgi:hypothetical protein